MSLKLTAPQVNALKNLFFAHRQKAVFVLSALAAGALFAFVFTHLYLWPLYLLAVAWAYVLKYRREKPDLAAAALATFVYVISAWLWSSGIAASLAPPGQGQLALRTWLGAPLATIWAMLSGVNLTPYAAKVREVWASNQLWFIPSLVGATCLLKAFAVRQDKERATLHGSAEFVDPPKVKLVGHKEGFLLGREKSGLKREVVLPLKEVCEHVLATGAPGAGKSASEFITNLLRLASNGAYANAVVTDPKMELLSICGPELLRAGYEVLVYHPYAPDLSDAWNMLSYAKDFESIDDMVLAIIANTGMSKDNYWDNQTNQLLDLICYHLRETLGEKASMSHVQALAGAASARDIEVTLKNSPNQKIKMNAAGFFSRIGENEKLISSITSDLPRRLKLWTLDPIRATTHVNEIDFSVLCTEKKVVLFVVTPMDKKEQLKPLFATFFTQLCKVVQEKGRELGKLPRPLWFLLDEFPNLGAIPNFDNFLTVVRGYNVGVVLGIQSRSQLAELYGDDRAKTIVEACATYIVFPRIGAEDAKYFSDMLGKRTVLTIEKSYNRHLFVTDWKHKEEEKAVARPLLGPDEIRALDKDSDLLVLAGTRRPVRISPAFYFKDPRWAALGEECRDENNLKARRSVFYRANRGKPPLDVPGEEQMMAEAAVLTAAALGKKGRKQEQVPAEQQKPDAPKTPAPAAGTQQGTAAETQMPVPAVKTKIKVNLRRQREWAARWHEKREEKKKSPVPPDNGEKQDKEQKTPGPAKVPPVLKIDDGKLFKK